MTTLHINSAGLLTTIQDNGRTHLRHLGIPWAGTLCPAWQKIANALVANAPNDPVLEVFEGGLSLTAMDGPVRVSIIASADAIVSLISADTDKRSLATLRSITIPVGDSLRIDSTGSLRVAIVAIFGLSLEKQLGSYSTYAKAGLGGLNGKALTQGDELQVSGVPEGLELQCELPDALLYERSVLRVVPGPQDDHFSQLGMHNFLNTTYSLTRDVDRMGARLEGACVEHRDAASKDIVSDAIFPGSIQIPGSGKPIVLLNDAHTAGGYPKIATLVSADLPLLALQRAKAEFQFVEVSIDEAVASKQEVDDVVHSTIANISVLLEPSLDSESLLGHNLIDGVTDGHCL